METLTILSGCFYGMGMPEIIFISMLIIFPLCLIPLIFYILTIQKALLRCSLQNRTMDPNQVWFLLIPVFSLVWNFIVVANVATTLGNEFRSRNIQKEPEPGKSLGLGYCILAACSIIPFLGFLTSLPGLICWIMYWVKISNYSNELAFSQPKNPVQ